MRASGLPRNVWIDVEDLFEFAVFNPRPSGIQRMAFEIYCAIEQLEGAGSRINFVRHDQINFTFSPVPWASVESIFNQLAAGTPNAQAAASARFDTSACKPVGKSERSALAESPLRRAARKIAYRLPLDIRHRAFTAARLQANAFKAQADLLVTTAHRLLPKRSGNTRDNHDNPAVERHQAGNSFAGTVKRGDIILLLGAPWSTPNYARMIEAARARYGIEFAVLIYDLIPMRRPEWCGRGLVRLFREWFTTVLPIADHIFTISHATAADIRHYLRESGAVARTNDIQVIPVGTSFGHAPLPLSDAAPISPGLPEPGSYALFVSTIEARKNHTLLFRVWRRLLEEMPQDEVPTLVFAGRVGWLVEDLMQQLEDTDWLGGKIRLIEAPADQDIAALYRGCMFTLFPSLYEGWGLPVTESLANGKPCLASSSTSMPEAGGTLARYFDPDSVTDAYRVIRDTIADKPGLLAWQAEVARCFKPVAWTATAASILDALDARAQRPQTARPKQPAA
jgi:glycosyltransferase involved in cell wall biosynthesis